jgi:hypothetical protein
MKIIIVGLILAVIVILMALAALLLIVRAGIGRQERGACLICHPPALTAAITRRVVNMHFRAPEQIHECRHTYRGPDAAASLQPRLSAKKGSRS